MQLIPHADQIPVHWSWFQVLLLLTFLIHIILVNFILGGSVLTLIDVIRGKTISKASSGIPTLIALTINFGVPPLLFIQVLYGQFFYSSSVIMAVPWILIIPVLIVAYYGAYYFVYKINSKTVLAKTGLFISTLILLVIAFLYVNNITLMLHPQDWGKYFRSTGGMNLNFSEPTLWPRYLHFIVASIAVAGIGKALFAYFDKKSDKELRNQEINSGLKIFSYATLVQIAVGVWFLLVLPGKITWMFLGRNGLATILLGIAVLLLIPTLIYSFRQNFRYTISGILLILILMILIRDLLRKFYLGEVFRLSDLEISGKYGSLILFLGAFIIGIASVYYMIRLITSSKKQ